MFEIKGKYTTACVHINNVDETTYAQIVKFVNHPYFTNPIHIMPDTHAGKGAVIGFTMELPGLKIIPNIIGVDVNCGMIATKLGNVKNKKNFVATNKRVMQNVDDTIRELIPMGFKIQSNTRMTNYDWDNMLKECKDSAINFCTKFKNKFGTNISTMMPTYNKEYIDAVINRAGVTEQRFYNSVGTLGGGNHFCEIGRDEDDNIWLTVHTGSRNFGNLIAKYWQGRAIYEQRGLTSTYQDEVEKLVDNLKSQGKHKEIANEISKLRKQYKQVTVPDAELAVASEGNAAGYFFDMIFAGTYANYNRRMIVKLILEAFNWTANETIESHHNFIDFDDMIIRKGAIASYKDQKMIIPFNMLDGLLIVEGKSNPTWNYSAPHGAGRIMSRSQARKTIQLDRYKSQMDGVFSTSVVRTTIDEAPDAYKSAKIIEEAIKDTCDIIYKVRPIINIKNRDDEGSKRRI